MDQNSNFEDKSKPLNPKSGRREIALNCISRPLSDATDYLVNHGSITRIYPKVSKIARRALKRRKEALNA